MFFFPFIWKMEKVEIRDISEEKTMLSLCVEKLD